MITFNTLGIHGQLGNQMFQYALLQGINRITGVDVIFNQKTYDQSYLFRIFNVKNFKVEEHSLIEEYREPKFTFNPEVFGLDNTSFFGYFQSDKYFNHCAEHIKEEFTFKPHTISSAKNLLKPFEGKTLTSVHVRRGDYLVNPDFHPTPSIDYYNTAFDLLDDGNTQFICMSDDINWCKSNFNRPNISFFYNSLDIDMCLISLCSNHIIANSSFSWWGSWLSVDRERKVVAPTPWFGPRAKDYDTADLYREEFIVI